MAAGGDREEETNVEEAIAWSEVEEKKLSAMQRVAQLVYELECPAGVVEDRAAVTAELMKLVEERGACPPRATRGAARRLPSNERIVALGCDGEGVGGRLVREQRTGETRAARAASSPERWPLPARPLPLTPPPPLPPTHLVMSCMRVCLSTRVPRAEMAPFYEHLCAKLGWARDDALLARLRAANEAAEARLDAAIKDAEEKFGESEVYDRTKAKAEYLAQIGAKDRAVAVYDGIPSKLISSGQKVDNAMAKAQLAFLFGDLKLAREQIDQAKELNEKGGDWDRRNRLKIYDAAHLMATREFSKAAALLLDCVATFTCVELFSYEDFVFYTVLTNLYALPRVPLGKRVVESPDILAVIDGIPHLGELLNSFFQCRYRAFFESLVGIDGAIRRDRYLGPHESFYVREVRVRAYGQYLESYKSVTIEGMSRTFGVTEAFLDRELARFIAAGRIPAKIDKVAGVIETTRPDSKTAHFDAVIKHGDVLLNRVQRYARVIAV